MRTRDWAIVFAVVMPWLQSAMVRADANVPAAAQPGVVGLVIELESAQPYDAHPGVTIVSLDATHVRIDLGERFGRRARVIDVASGVVEELFPDKRLAVETTRAQRDVARQELEQRQRTRDEHAHQTLSPEEYAEFQRRSRDVDLNGRALQLAFTPTGAKRTVGGIACDVYRVTDEGKLLEEACVAPFGPQSLTRAETAVLRAADATDGDEALNVRLGLSAWAGLGVYPGFPIARKRVSAGGSFEWEHRVARITRGPLAAAVFSVPADYAKRPGSDHSAR